MAYIKAENKKFIRESFKNLIHYILCMLESTFNTLNVSKNHNNAITNQIKNNCYMQQKCVNVLKLYSDKDTKNVLVRFKCLKCYVIIY